MGDQLAQLEIHFELCISDYSDIGSNPVRDDYILEVCWMPHWRMVFHESFAYGFLHQQVYAQENKQNFKPKFSTSIQNWCLHKRYLKWCRIADM